MRTRSFKTSSTDDSNWDKIFQHFGVTGDGDTELFRELQKKLLLNINSSPLGEHESDIGHLNIDEKDGAIQTYLNKRKERIEETYLKEQARQKAKTEGETARAAIQKEIENQKRFTKQYIRDRKPKIDWGDSQGAEPDWHEGYR